MDPSNANALFNRGSALDSLGVFRPKAHRFTSAICVTDLSRPKKSSIHSILHVFIFEPLRFFKVRLDPSNANALFNRGSALDSLG